MVVGFDFSFSYPAWFLRELGIGSAPEFWRLVADGQGERWLHRDCEDGRFWGRVGSLRHGKKPAEFCGEHAHRMLRRAETVLKVRAEIADPLAAARIAGIAPKSVFQIGGAGAVGTASLRGMPGLLRLREAGFRIWPYDAPSVKRAAGGGDLYAADDGGGDEELRGGADGLSGEEASRRMRCMRGFRGGCWRRRRGVRMRSMRW